LHGWIHTTDNRNQTRGVEKTTKTVGPEAPAHENALQSPD